MNRNLIFCAVGPGPGTVPFRKERDATWDLVEVLWHPDMIRAIENGRYVTSADVVLIEPDRTKRKFACFAEAFWRLHPLDIFGNPGAYDAVLIADDDLIPVGCTWSDVFALFHETGLTVAQPALAPGSTVISSACVTHQQPSRWRRTNFVEVMMPIFRGDVIEELLPYFLDEKYGLGLEMLWRERFPPIGVLDATPVLHTRPLGSAHSMTGVDSHPWQQAREFRARHGLTNEDDYPVATLEWHPPESEPQPPPPPDRRGLAPELAHARALADSYKDGAARERQAANVMQARVIELERQLVTGGAPVAHETRGSLWPRLRPNLLFMSVGPGPGTVDVRRGDYSHGSWDLVEVLWHPQMIADDRRGKRKSHADLVIYDPDRTKRKFACFADLYREQEIAQNHYGHVAILDDDLEPFGCTWSAIFELFRSSILKIAQPALTPDSAASKPITVQCPDALYRVTDYVEVMAPFFRGEVLHALIPDFLEERNGWGLEALWSNKYGPIGILDATPVRHMRPVGTAHSLGGLGVDPERRADAYRRRHGLSMPLGVTLRTVMP